MGIKFGTDGWRDIIADRFTFENVRKVAQAHANHIKDNGGKSVVIGYDTRFMSEDFAKAAAEVFSSNGLKVFLSKGHCTTPGLSLATRELGADEGVMITASHNTYKYNGYKVKSKYGGPATVDIIKDIEARLDSIDEIKTGTCNFEEVNINDLYIKTLKSYFSPDTFKQIQLKVVHDPMYGATMHLLRKILEGTFIETLEINAYRDAFFGFKHPEPIDKNLSLLKAKVVATEANLGIANDGDGDRVGIVDEGGEFLSTQIVYALLLLHTLRYRKEKGIVAKTVSTTYLADRIAEKEGRRVVKTPVGFKYIADIFLKEKVAFGGEESGGYGFGFHIPERDGLLSGLLVLEMMILTGKSLIELVDDLFKEFGTAYYKREDLRVKGDEGRQLVQKLKEKPMNEFAGEKVKEVDLTDGVKLIFDDDSWVLFRASGTEPVLRLYVETPSKEKTEKFLQEAKNLVG